MYFYIMKSSGHLLPLLFLCFTSCFIADAAKILVYCPSISKSHVLLCSKYADVLHKGAHDTVLFIPTYQSELADFTGAKHAKVWKLQNVTEAYDRQMQDSPVSASGLTMGFYERLQREAFFWSPMCQDLVNQLHRMQHVVDYKFDVAIYNDIDPCNPSMVRSLGIPKTVLLSSEPIMDKIAWDLGLPAVPSYVPTVEENANHDRMDFFERMSNAYKLFQSVVVNHLQVTSVLNIFRKTLSSDFPSTQELIRNCSLVLVNTDEMFDIPRPISHKIVYVGMLGGGIHENNSLSQDLEHIFDKGQNGSVFISFGTVSPFNTLSEATQSAIYFAISNMSEYHFVLKVSSDDKSTRALFENVTNIDLVEWVPQSAVLRHSNLKLFVSHGGMNSVLETMYYGVPMLIMPVFTDQFRNAKTVERRGAGKMIDKDDITKESFIHELTDVLSNPRYQINAMRMSQLMKTRPFTPEERVLKWMNFVIEHDVANQLDLESNNLSLIQIYHFDVFFFLVTSYIALVVVYKKIIPSFV